jgi:ABC-2 type transport system ATP-binding protein
LEFEFVSDFDIRISDFVFRIHLQDTSMIETRDLTKMYGELYALDRLTLKLERGDVYGFIGPNGAGKTTTMRILATLLNPTWGEATVCGYSIYNGAKDIRRVMGYMPDFFGVYDQLTVAEYLDFYAACYRQPKQRRTKIVGELLELIGLTDRRDQLVDTLSRGLKQRLCLARALVHDPVVLLLDEPASGLDPRARVEMREILKELRGMGKTIIISSHILPELTELCTMIGIIDHGRMRATGSVQDVIRGLSAGRRLRINIVGAKEPAIAILEPLESVRRVERNYRGDLRRRRVDRRRHPASSDRRRDQGCGFQPGRRRA